MSLELISDLREAKSLTDAIKTEEARDINRLALFALTAKSVRYAREHQVVIDGEHFPETGPFVATGIHVGAPDALTGHLAAMRDHRVLRVVVKTGLTSRTTESEQYLTTLGTTKARELNEYRAIQAWVLRGMNTHPILRDSPDMEALFKRGRAEIEAGHPWAIFLQGHRQPDCVLRDLQLGPAYFAQKLDVPIYPIAFSRPPADEIDRVTILKPFTYKELREKHGRRLSLGEMTVMIADMIAPHLPKSSQQDWEQRRESELIRLTTSKKR